MAACGYQHIRMFEVSSNKGSPVVNYEGVSKNVMGVGFQEEGRWMYTGESLNKVNISNNILLSTIHLGFIIHVTT